mgnify:CR=1 FL=1
MKQGFFFDMDGTLYNNDYHEVSIKTFKALKQLQQNGHIVCLATSRTIRELDNLPRAMFNFDFYYRILDGGSLILDKEGNTIDKKVIPESIMEDVVKFCDRNHLTLRYSTENGNYFHDGPTDYEYKFYHWLYLNTPDIKKYDKDDALNILVYTYTDEQAKEVLDIVKGCSIVRYKDCFEIKPEHTDKALSIQKIIEWEKIDRSYCFGDGPNDVDMLKIADVGIAMGNGCKACKEVADVVIGNVDEDAIYKYLLENNLCKEVD